jgi:hypothetical protein
MLMLLGVQAVLVCRAREEPTKGGLDRNGSFSLAKTNCRVALVLRVPT